MPERIVTHWDHLGEPDGYMHKTFGLFMLTFIIGMMSVLFIVFPKVKPIKDKIEKNLSYYYTLTIWFMLLFLFINVHIVLWNSQIAYLNPLRVMKLSFIVLALGLIICKIKTKNLTQGK